MRQNFEKEAIQMNDWTNDLKLEIVYFCYLIFFSLKKKVLKNLVTLSWEYRQIWCYCVCVCLYFLYAWLVWAFSILFSLACFFSSLVCNTQFLNNWDLIVISIIFLDRHFIVIRLGLIFIPQLLDFYTFIAAAVVVVSILKQK